MRTTLTIDDDVAATLEQVRRKRDISLKDVINEALRLGLRDMTARQKPHSLFRTKSVDLGGLRVGSIDNIAETLAIAEREDFD
jgi:Ribbon-helix-helix protein, copG family